MNTTWFITGTSSGLGRELTEQLLARGDRVAATVRKPQALDDLKARYGDRLWIGQLDVTDSAAVRKVMADAFAALGRIDVVVSNAAYALFGAGEELGDVQIDQQIATNLTGSIQVIRAALPPLRAQGGGRILQISSEGGQIAYPNFSLYHATKWGIEGFVESVAQEVAPFGIEITLVEPGPARTGFASALVSAEPMAVYDDTPVRRGAARGCRWLVRDSWRCGQDGAGDAGLRAADHRRRAGWCWGRLLTRRFERRCRRAWRSWRGKRRLRCRRKLTMREGERRIQTSRLDTGARFNLTV